MPPLGLDGKDNAFASASEACHTSVEPLRSYGLALLRGDVLLGDIPLGIAVRNVLRGLLEVIVVFKKVTNVIQFTEEFVGLYVPIRDNLKEKVKEKIPELETCGRSAQIYALQGTKSARTKSYPHFRILSYQIR